MKKFEVLYCPIGVKTFDLESAKKIFTKSISLLESIERDVIVPEEMLLSMELLQNYLEGKNPDLVIVQNITFANSNYAKEIFTASRANTLLWTLREPVIDGGRLRLNSLTGAFSAGNAFANIREEDSLLYLFGSPEEIETKSKLKKIIETAKLKFELKNMNLLMIGHTPQGFGFGRALDLEMTKNFGVNLLAIESRELTNLARKLTDNEFASAKETVESRMTGIENTKLENQVDFYKLYSAYKKYIKDNNIKAIASRCWPDFFTDYGTPVCGVLGMLNQDGIAAACEADTYGALSMYLGQYLSKKPTYFGDPVSIDETENTITFWHCGTGACSLAREDTISLTGVHPNRKIGPTMEFGLKPSKKATIFRIGRKPNGKFRFLLLKAKILDKPKQFLGTSLVCKIKSEVKPLITKLVKAGWEPHYIICYDDILEELEILADMLNIEVCKY
ncbi:MAG: fucose isomerase [Sphaerochaetaceae bacterium]|nr:fucose isomerase [Sphaerochaetaceae bacterium]